GQYSSSRTGPLLLRSVLPIFPQWRSDALLARLLDEQDAAERDFALTLLTAYGRDVYGQIVDTLERSDASAPWHFLRSLAYLLGHLATDQAPLRARAVSVLAGQLRKDGVAQVNVEVVNALSALRTDPAVDALAGKLTQFAPEFGQSPAATDICNRIV